MDQTPAEALAAEIGNILDARFPHNFGVDPATADILEAVARYEAAVAAENARAL
jgi:hypothetical protein